VTDLETTTIPRRSEGGLRDHVGPGSERVVVITGATGKLGPTVAAAFAEAGDRVAVLARDGAEVDALAASLPGGPGRHLGFTADLLSADDAIGAARAVRERLGPPAVLLHLAGGYAGGSGIADTDPAQLQDLIDVNVWTTFFAIRAFIADIRAAQDGRIITVSSVAGFMQTGTYSAAKAWATTFTASLAGELAGTGVTATALCPGFVRTEFHQRMGLRGQAAPSWAWLDADRLVADCLRDVARGRAVSIPSLRYRAATAALRHLPLRLNQAIGRRGRRSR